MKTISLTEKSNPGNNLNSKESVISASTQSELQASDPWYYKLCKTDKQRMEVQQVQAVRKALGGRPLSRKEIMNRLAVQV